MTKTYPVTVIRTVAVDLTSAEIKAMFATPILVIPGIAEKVISIIKIVTKFTYGGVAYAGGGAVSLRDSVTTATVVSVNTMTAAQVNGVLNLVTTSPGGITSPIQGIGAGLSIANATAAFTTGTGTMKLIITYQIITP